MKSRYLKFITLGFAILTITIGINGQTKNVKTKPQRARIEITEQGFAPGIVHLKRSVPVRVTFIRRTDATCATSIVVAEYGFNRPLPLNQPVVFSFTPKRSGIIGFACGMNMMQGKMIVR